jgi:hypothetical protein
MNQINSKTLKYYGIVTLFAGPTVCYSAWEMQHKKVGLVLAFMGVMAIVFGIAMAFVPLRLLLKPNSIVDGQPVYDNDAPKYTPLMVVICADASIGGAAYVIFLFINNR